MGLMATYGKRHRNISESAEGSSSDEYEPYRSPRLARKKIRMTDGANSNISPWNTNKTMEGCVEKKPKRQPKCFSRNALMARENRLKKKIYIENLEKEVAYLKNENKKMSGVMENQSFLISELRKEIKYLKSVLANSPDISKLIKCIQHNTGMQVSSSLDHSLNDSKLGPPIAGKTAYPWDQTKNYLNYSSTDSYTTSPETVESAELDLLLTDDILNDPGEALDESKSLLPLNITDEEACSLPQLPSLGDELKTEPMTAQGEHCYTFPEEDTKDDVGVCLHVSKHKVSLEFCPSCSENAAATWDKVG